MRTDHTKEMTVTHLNHRDQAEALLELAKLQSQLGALVVETAALLDQLDDGGQSWMTKLEIGTGIDHQWIDSSTSMKRWLTLQIEELEAELDKTEDDVEAREMLDEARELLLV